jgi:hypothetical protein
MFGKTPASRFEETLGRALSILVLGAILVFAALLSDFETPPYPWASEPYITDGTAAWCVGFVVMALAATVIARARSPLADGDFGKLAPAGFACAGVGVLLLLLVMKGTSSFMNHDLSDITYGLPYAFAPPLPAIFTLSGVAMSGFVSAPRLLTLVFSSAAGAFTLSHVWERKVFDGLNVLVVILAWIAIFAVVALMTALTPDVRSSREPAAHEPASLDFLAYYPLGPPPATTEAPPWNGRERLPPPDRAVPIADRADARNASTKVWAWCWAAQRPPVSARRGG